MEVTHLYALIPLVCLFLFTLLAYKKVISFVATILYAGSVGWVAFFQQWEWLIFIFVGFIGIVSFIGLVKSASEGELY